MALSMDSNNFALYVHELRNQCVYAETAINLFNQSMEKQSTQGAFYAIHTFLTAASQIGRLLWPNRAKAKRRGETLRAALGIPETFPLGDDRLLNLWDMADEKTDDWIRGSKNQIIAYDYLGPISELKPKQPKDQHIYRAYDPTTHYFYFRGEVFNIQLLASRVAEVAARINQAHDQIFPKPKESAEKAEEKAEDITQDNAPAPAPAE